MVKREKICPGVTLHYTRADKFKSEILGIIIHCPLQRETVTVNSLLALLLKNGSASFSGPAAVARRLEMLYGAVFDVSIVKKGDEQCIFLYLETVRQATATQDTLREGIKFLQEILVKPREGEICFSKEQVEREKCALREKIRQKIDDKKEYARTRCLEIMFAEEPFGIYAEGYEEDVEALTESRVSAQYQKLYQEAPVEILFSGRTALEWIRQEVSGFFDCTRKETKLAKEQEKDKKKKIEVTKRIEQMELLQAKLCVAFRMDLQPKGKDFFSAMVCNELFGGGANSKLFNQVREKEGLCYYINTFLYRFKMVLFLQAGIEGKQADRVVTLAKQSLQEVLSGEFSTEEFENAKTALIKSYSNLQDYQTAEMDFHFTQYLLGAEETIDGFQNGIDCITEEDIRALADKIQLDTVYLLTGTESRKEGKGHGGKGI